MTKKERTIKRLMELECQVVEFGQFLIVTELTEEFWEVSKFFDAIYCVCDNHWQEGSDLLYDMGDFVLVWANAVP